MKVLSARFSVAVALFVLAPSLVRAQTSIQGPEKKYLFEEDSHHAAKAKKKAAKSATTEDKPAVNDLDIQAPRVEYGKDQRETLASGGVAITSGSMRIQSDSAVIDSQTKDSQLNGRVVMSSPEARVVAEHGTLNLDTEAGKFQCGSLVIEDSNYRAHASEVRKLDDRRFELSDAKMTTCACADSTDADGKSGAGKGCAEGSTPPWSINSSTVHVTRDGYAHAYNSWIDFHGVPVLYSPYIGFPVKEKRQTGLLVPSFGYNNKDGFKAKIPLFVTLGDSADVSIAPFTEVKTRTGFSFDYREAYSRYNQLRSRFYYSDESARNGDLRGTNVDGLFDPTFDVHRFGGMLNHVWRSEPDAAFPLSYVADAHYVSDDLFLREIDDAEMGDPTQTSTDSRALITAGLGEYGSAELLGEYTQALDNENDDRIFKRLPELNVELTKSLRPFGYNPYGVKLVTKVEYLGDDFYRKQGYDGYRNHVVPSLTVPFHVQNIAAGSVGVSYLHTDYSMDNRDIPGTSTQLDSSSSRDLPVVSAAIGTAVERVFQIDPHSWFSELTMLGKGNQDQLVRLKHTIEPQIKFTGIPHRDQADLPQFDPIDRISEKRQLTYGFRSSLYGRFLPRNRTGESVLEAVPEVGTVQPLTTDSMDLPSFGQDYDSTRLSGFSPLRDGDTRELVTLLVKQNYDILEDSRNRIANRNGFSDVDANLYLIPTPSFAIGLESSIDAQDSKFTSWAISNNFFSDRGDALRARWTYARDPLTQNTAVSQIEASAELKVIERLKFGLYTRYDEDKHSNIESRGAVRFFGSCNCWHVDLGYGSRVNPDKKELTLSFTLHGLGDLAQSMRVNNSNR